MSFSEQLNLKNKILLLFVQTYQKTKEVPYMEMSQDNDQEKQESPYTEMSRDKDQKVAFISNVVQLQHHSFTFLHKK